MRFTHRSVTARGRAGSWDVPSVHQQRLSQHHERIRRRGVNPWVYWPVRALLQPFLQIFFRLRRGGRHHVPDGGVLLASNHRSFLDPFVIGCCVRRPIYFVAKQELFERPLRGLVPELPRGLPGQARRVRRGVDGHGARAAGARRGRGDLPRGHPPPVRSAAPAEARGGQAGAGERRAGGARSPSRAPSAPGGGSCSVPCGWTSAAAGRSPTRAWRRPSKHLATEVTARIWPCVELQWAWLGGPMPIGEDRRVLEQPRAARGLSRAIRG